MQSNAGTRSLSVRDLTYTALMTALMAVCAWITVPMTVPFTMQTFGVFMALLVLGGAKGTTAIALYILLGMAGVPVFSGFNGGIGVLAGPTGGYIVGFLFTGILYWVLQKFCKNRKGKAGVLAAGLCLCYAFGTVWFSLGCGKPYQYEAVFYQHRYRIDSSGKTAEIKVDGRSIGRWECGCRVVTGERGELLKILRITPSAERPARC